MKQINHNWILRLVLIITLLLPLFNLLTPGYFLGHDTVDHIARIANFYANLQEGTLIPRWAGNLNWGYGHPILMFLYPLPSYIASIFIALGFSYVDATKLVFATAFVASGISMCLWIRSIWGEHAGVVAAILYTFAPYRFVDLYVRGALGEHVFFIWPPLVCYFLYKTIRTKNTSYAIGLAISIAAMILSHNALSIMYLPFLLVYVLITLVVFQTKTIRLWIISAVSIVLGFGLSAFFWIPAFFEGKYTLRDIVTKGQIFNHFESISRLLNSSWNFEGTGKMSVQAGLLQWAFIAIGTVLIFIIYRRYKSKKRYDKKQFELYNLLILALSLLTFIVSIVMMLELSSIIYKYIALLQKFQFPWRFLSLSLFVPAIVGGVFTYYLKEKYRSIAVAVVIIGSVMLTYTFWHAKDYKTGSNDFFNSIYEGTTDTGESAPIWSVRFMEETPENKYEIAEGDADVVPVQRSIQKREYTIDVISNQVRFIEHTLYFPGWTVYIDGQEMGQEMLLFHDPAHRGLINFYVPQGEHVLMLQFKNTKVRYIANTITIISVLFLVTFVVYKHKNLHHE